MKYSWPLSRFPEQRDNGPVLRRSTIPILSTSIIFPFPLRPVFSPGIPGLQAAEVKRESCHVTNYFLKILKIVENLAKSPAEHPA